MKWEQSYAYANLLHRIMTLTTIFAAKYGPTIVKALLAYYQVTHKEAFDLPLKALENYLKEGVDEFQKSDFANRLQQDVLNDLKHLYESGEDETTFRRAAEVTAETLETIPLYPLLFEHIFAPERVAYEAMRSGEVLIRWEDQRLIDLRDRILDATLKAFALRIHQLPGFHAWFIREARRRFEAGDRRLERLEGIIDQGLADELRFELDYLRTLSTELDVVRLFIKDVPFEGPDVAQKLEAAYIKLQLGSKSNDDSSLIALAADDLLDRVAKGKKRILVLGSAGSGKTTLLRWYGLRAAKSKAARREDSEDKRLGWIENRIASDRDRWQDRVPFFIQLRYLPDIGALTPNEFFCSVKPRREIPPGWAQKIVDQGRALILVDGLDELSPLQRKNALKWIGTTLTSYHNDNLIVATSRPQALPEGVLSEQGFDEYEVHELGFDARIECAKAWHRAVALELTGKPMVTDDLLKKQDRLIKSLEKGGPIAQLASTPLFCALICALNRSPAGSLPNSFANLCKLIVQMLLNDRDDEQELSERIVRKAYADCRPRERLHTIRNLAEKSLEEERYWLLREEALLSIAATLYKALPEEQNEVTDVLNGLIAQQPGKEPWK